MIWTGPEKFFLMSVMTSTCYNLTWLTQRALAVLRITMSLALFCKVDSYQAHAYDCFAKLMREWSTVDMKAIDDGTWSLVLSAELPLVFVARYGINGHPENG